MINVNTTADNLTAGDGHCTLREAIANVNLAADITSGDCTAGTGTGDTIAFNLTLPASIRLRSTLGGLLIRQTVTITGPGSGSLGINGRNRTRVFEIAAGTTNISDLTIRRGRGADSGGGVFVGGGVLVDQGAMLTLTNCTLTRNTARPDGTGNDSGAGGAIYNAGSLTLNDCSVTRNLAGGREHLAIGEGGAIYNGSTGTLTLTDCRLSGNKALGGSAQPVGWPMGGAISNYGTMTLSHCTINSNQCHVAYKVNSGDSGYAFGGGIENQGTAILNDCTIGYNLVASGVIFGYGGGGGIDNSGSATLTNCTLVGNSVIGGYESSGRGGGISNGNDCTLTNCTLVGNSVIAGAHAFVYGGGIDADGNTIVTNCTLSHNIVNSRTLYDTVGAGGGISGNVLVTNSIIAASGLGGNCEDGGTYSGGQNISDDDTCFSDGGSDLLNTNPQLAPRRNYGGSTQTLALCSGAEMPHPACTARSPAIDAGDDAVTAPPDNLSTDQRGLPRKAGAHVDIGAYEVQ